MEICFYNTKHIGDVYFTSLIINLICKLNKTHFFYYYFFHGDIFFKNTTNIKRINKIEKNYTDTLINGGAPEQLVDGEIYNILVKNNMVELDKKIIEINGKKILFVNTWCASSFLQHEDYNLIAAINSYKSLIDKINNDFNLNLAFEINNPFEVILQELQVFEKTNYYKENYINKEDNDLKDTIFVFNYIPRSFIYDMNILYNYISNLLTENNKIILSSYESKFADISNVKFIDRDYKIYPDPICENLINIWEIASKCKKIILLPTGGSWTFLHKLNKLNHDQLFMFGHSTFCDKLNNVNNLLLGENKNLINNVTF
jgi:hypothetical protein